MENADKCDWPLISYVLQVKATRHIRQKTHKA